MRATWTAAANAHPSPSNSTSTANPVPLHRATVRSYRRRRIERLSALPLPAGTHQLAVRFTDDVNIKEFICQAAEAVTLAPGKVLVIDFDAEKRGITLS